MPTYLVGIEYDCPYDDKGFFDMQRPGPLGEIAGEIIGMELHGWSYPVFPPHCDIKILYVMDYANRTSLEPYEELMNQINQHKLKEVS